MTVRELIRHLLYMPMDADVKLEVRTNSENCYSEGKAERVLQISTILVLIEEE